MAAESIPMLSTTPAASTAPDHEVNIKILLNGALSVGDLTLKQRNKAAGGYDRRSGRAGLAR